jgi:antiviral helicase SKI2
MLNKLIDKWNEINTNNLDFKNSFDIYINNYQIINEINSIKNNNDYLNKSSSENIYNILLFLKEIDFIYFDNNHYNLNKTNAYLFINILKKENLTKKGIMSCQLNECENILMSYILETKILHSLSTIEIITILSIFINDGKINQDILYLQDINIPTNIKEIIKIINNINTKTETISLKYNISYNFEPYYFFLENCFLWSQGKNMKEILNITQQNIYEGNFIKNIIKINNICLEIIETLKIINDNEFIEKLSLISNILIRDIIQTSSIYLN